MSKAMELAIFWLPLIGTAVFGAIGISAYFGGGKIAGVWFGFIGCVCLLLTVALQWHQALAASERQPDVALLAPVTPWHFRWSPDNWPVLRSPNEQMMESASVAAKFELSNKGAPASDASLMWEAPVYDSAAILSAWPRLADWVGDFKAGQFSLKRPGDEFPLIMTHRSKARMSIPFLTRPVETYLPLEVWWRGFVLGLAQLPTLPYGSAIDIEFRATVSWNIPAGGVPKTMIVTAHVKNTKNQTDPALFDADITFSVRPASQSEATS